MNAEFFKHVDVHLRKDYGRVHFESAEFGELLHRKHRRGTRYGAYRKRDKNFVGVKSRIAVAEMLGFKNLNGFDNRRR